MFHSLVYIPSKITGPKILVKETEKIENSTLKLWKVCNSMTRTDGVSCQSWMPGEDMWSHHSSPHHESMMRRFIKKHSLRDEPHGVDDTHYARNGFWI